MENTYTLNALPLDFSGETDIEMAIYGTANYEKREKDKIASALNRYVESTLIAKEYSLRSIIHRQHSVH